MPSSPGKSNISMLTPQMQNPIILKSGRKVVDDGRCRSLLQRYDHPRLRSYSVPGALYFIGTECRCTPAQLGAPDRAQRYERLRSYGSARNAAGKRYNAPCAVSPQLDGAASPSNPGRVQMHRCGLPRLRRAPGYVRTLSTMRPRRKCIDMLCVNLLRKCSQNTA